jgi:fibronectin-binding autotransporter adhesin
MGEKTASVGHFQIPTAPAALTAVAQSASANTLGAAVSFGNAPSALFITGVTIGVATTQTPTYIQIQILVTASIVASVLVPYGVSSAAASSVVTGYRAIYPPIPVANAAAITVKSASSVASAVAWGVSLECIAQANVVDDGVAVATVTTVTNQLTAAQIATGVWQDATAGDFTTASSIGKALYIANIAPGASGGLFISGSNAGTTTFGALTVTGATTLTGNVVLSDGLTVSAPSTLNRAGIDVTGNGTGAAFKLAAGATGKGIAVTTTAGDGLSILPTAGSAIVATGNGTSKHGIIATGGTAGTSDGATFVSGTGGVDFRASQTGNLTGNISGSVGSVTGAVGSVTGLTASNLDATISSRMATYTQPTGFLAATFPATVASTTNITAGTITTVTNLTNAPTAGDLTATMKTSVTTAATAATPTAAAVTGAVGSVTGNVGGNVTGSVGSVVGAVGSVTGNVGGNVVGSVASVTAAVLLPTIPANWISASGIAASALNGKGDWNIGKTGYSLTQTFPSNFSVQVISATGVADANIKSVAGTTVTGSGTSGSPWGP